MNNDINLDTSLSLSSEKLNSPIYVPVNSPNLYLQRLHPSKSLIFKMIQQSVSTSWTLSPALPSSMTKVTSTFCHTSREFYWTVFTHAAQMYQSKLFFISCSKCLGITFQNRLHEGIQNHKGIQKGQIPSFIRSILQIRVCYKRIRKMEIVENVRGQQKIFTVD